jgi:3D-(3,5/4)-trihydroxycyclohexane-1,2-dione acylhydrolase (decyclizing)
MSALLNAMRVLTDPEKTGGVCITIPQDVQGETYPFPDYFFKKRVHRISRLTPDELEVKDVIELIQKKERPLVIVGGGVRYSEAGEEIVKFCEKYNIPFAETQAGKSAITSSHPLNLGGVGVTGNSAANTIATQADLVIGVGTRLTDFTTGSKELFRNPKVEFVLVNVSRYHAEKLDALPMVSDAKKGIDALHSALENSDYKTSYTTEIKEAKLGWVKEMEFLTGNVFDENYTSLVKAKEALVEEDFIKATGGIITQTAAIGMIRDTIEEDAIIVGAAGSLPGDLQRMWTTNVKGSYHMEYGYSCMGYEIAATLGAKLANPDRACYSMVGDGSFMMLHSELATALQEKQKITVLLFDNCGFGCINNLQMGKGMGSLATMFRYRDEETRKQDGDLIVTDFAMIGRGYGMTTFTAKTAEELKYALEEAKKQENSVLIDIKVLPKSMTDGYDAWWHVGIGDSATNDKIKESYENKVKYLDKARKY